MTKRQPKQPAFRPQPNRLAQAIRMLLSGGVLLAGATRPALAELPVPCASGTCGAGGPSVWVSSGAATSSVVANTLNINQSADKAIFNWQTFNVSADSTVNFHQPGSASIALNRVLGNLGPSRIFGTINANGQVYLINPNGILFGKGARVNVGALVASTLDVNDQVFKNNSILQPILEGKPAFTGGSPTAAITVDKGATLRAADGGSIMIFAPTVTNAGDIETPGGQAVLAASKDEVYLQQSSDPNLRGLVVEVKTGGSVTNLGKIAARRGNVTLLGFAVNQDGLVSATTSVRVNGSIRLLARDGAYVDTTGTTPVLTATSTAHAGTPAAVTFGSGSVTQVLPETDDPTTAPDSQVQNPSIVDVMGRTITLKSGAAIQAPAGKVSLTATANPGKPDAPPAAPDDSRITLQDGSLIDVSGTTSTTLPMSRNTVQVNLRGYDLRDSPLQRNGLLYGKTITVDIRKGTPLADWQSTAAAIGRTVDERSAHGGDVSFLAGGDVNFANGAEVNVSGGSVTYQGGYVDTTKLVSNGKLYDISQADPNLQYQIAGEYSYTYKKWGVTQTWHGAAVGGLGDWQPGYVQGADAGSVSFKTPALALAGRIVAHTVQSPYQRYLAGQLPSGCQLASACQVPLGGSLTVDLNGTANPALATEDVRFQNGDAGAAAPADATAATDLVIDSGALGAQGVSRLSVSTRNGAVHIAPGAELRLPAGGSVALTADQLDIQGGVDIPGGTATFKAVAQGDANSSITLGPFSHVSVAGQWVNDSPLLNPDGAAGPVCIDGGDITVNAQGDVTLAPGSVLDVSGGAWLQSDGTVQGGNAGSIAVATAQRNGGSTMELGAELRGYALNGGGTLDLTANSILIQNPGAPAAPNPAPEQLRLAPDFFRRGGFKSYRLTSNLGGLTVAGGVDLVPQVSNLALDASAGNTVTGTDISAFSRVVMLPDQDRSAADLSLTVARSLRTDAASRAVLNVEPGAVIRTDPGASVSLTSDDSIQVAGTIDAPGGNIELTVTPPTVAEPFPGFLRDQGIWLGPDARLLARAYALALPNDTGLREARLLAGGQINLEADRGYLLTSPGSLIDVSGLSKVLDLPDRYTAAGIRYRAISASAPAGAVSLTAAEGMLLDGTLRGRAAEAPGAAGGRLAITMYADPRVPARGAGVPAGHAFLTNPDIVQIYSGSGSVTPVNLPNGAGIPVTVPDNLNKQALVSAETLQQGGFDAIALHAGSMQSDSEVHFHGDVSLQARRSLVLNAPLLEADGAVDLHAAYVALGSSVAATGSVSGGSGSFTVHAAQIDLTGNTQFQGIGKVGLQSSGDIRLEGIQATQLSRTFDGSLVTAGDLVLKANQVYPSTLSTFKVDAGAGTLTIEGGGGTPVLSAGGNVTLHAARIVQDGVLKAPAGQIDLQADDSLTLGAGSITSVSEEGQIIPFGQTEFGKDWVYYTPVAGQPPLVITAPPTKRISLRAHNVDVAPGATVDLSGGGDLLGYEFVPGIGGSTDVLDPSTTGAKYAILPGYQGAYAPYDPQIWSTAGLQMGDSLYLSGGGGLPSGNYVLLPARYALLPGAFLVTPMPGTSDIAPGEPLTRSDGAGIVAGQRTVAGTAVRDSRWSGFVVEPGTIARTRSEYRLNLARSLFARQAAINGTAVPLLPNDAGQLIISSDGGIGLEGHLQGSPAAGGREAQVDIAATDLAVVNTTDPHSASVQLRAADLNGLGASLLLGGTRKAEHDGTHLDVTAQQVQVQDGVTLSGPEVLLAATDTVDLGAGSKVAGTGVASASDPALVINGDGALLRVSSADQVDIRRTGTSGATGTLSVGAGAVVKAGRSIVMDATAGTHSDGRIDLANGGSLNLGAERISLGNAPADTGGLVLAGTDLNALHLGQLVLTSRSTVDLFGAVSLNANELRIDAAGIGGYGAAGDKSSLSAKSLQLDNTAGATLPSVNPPAGHGDLTVDATDLNVGPGSVTVSGFDKVDLSAAGRLSGQGVGSLNVNADLTIKAGRVTAGSAADTTLDAGSHTVTIAAAPAAASPLTGSLGGHLSILGRSILQQGTIQVPAGTVTLHATGSESGDGVTLAAGSSIDVAGPPVPLGDVIADAPGGSVILTADAGDVAVQVAAGGLAAARIDVSGGGDAGTLKVNAPHGEVRLSAADLAGQGGSGHAQGSFQLDAATVDDLLGLNVRLDAAGFTAARRLRVRTGDVLLNGIIPALIHARQVSVTADGGSITVQGGAGGSVIDASGATGGSVTLAARDDVILDTGAVVDTHATAAGAKGGSVFLRSSQGDVTLKNGSQMDVAGGSGGAGGSVAVRVSRTALGGGAGVVSDGTISGAANATVEANQHYQVTGDGTISSADTNTYFQDAKTFMDNAVTGGLYGDLKAKSFTLTPGVEVDGSGALTLGADWDLHNWRFGPDNVPGVLTLRAAGNLTLPHSLSDGFDSSGLLAGASWSYRLVSGADTASADPLALLPAADLAAGQGSLTLGTAGSPQTIRTGTGSIEIATGGNLVLADSASTIYTAGVPTGSGTENSILVVYAIPGDYPAGGGDIDIRAQGDIKAQPVKQLITAWLRRLGEGDPSSSPGLPTTWNINFKNFQQGIGALGGGNVTVRADGNITNLSVSVPTTGKQVGEPLNPTDPSNFQVKENQIDVQGGGNIRVSAGGDIGSGVFFEDGGTATLRAGGSIDAASDNAVKPILALGAGTFDLQAARDVALETVFNASMVKQTPYANPMPPGTGSAFFTYGADSAVNVTALGGDVRLYNDITHITDNSLFPSPGYTAYGTDQQLRDALTIYPGTLRVDALLGSIDLKNSLTLFPSANGHLALLAGDSISTLGNTQAKITQSDADPALQPSMLHPIAADSPGAYTNNPLFGGGVQVLHATTPMHTGDPVPVRIVAAHGDVGGADTSQSITLSLAQPARIQAGRDILNLILYGQNLAPTDVTSVQAGRDIRSVNTRDPNTGLFTVNGLPLAQIGGAGQLEVLAGRNLDLGVGDGIITTGARFNPSLSPTGASLTVMAGLSQPPDYAAFIDRYLGAGGGYSDRVTGYMRALTGNAGLDPATALARFKVLPVVEQRAVVLQAFFNALKQSGIYATSGSKDYSRGFAAIATLFPGGPAAYQGDISLPFSRIQTLAGGDINMLAPGGQVDGGVASTSVFVKPASQLGVVAVGTGDINGFVDGDFLVNQSRVFALDGGNILLWSSRGNIDAGRGPKTALAASPAVVTTNSNGEVVVTYPPTVSGSGIRNGVATPGRSAGNIYLFAPGGVVNAGDAGIATAGNLTIGATQVIGSDNINVGGVSVGVPVADTGSLAAGLTGVSNLSSTVSKSAEQATQSVADQNNAGSGLGADTLTMIDVQVLGYGE